MTSPALSSLEQKSYDRLVSFLEEHEATISDRTVIGPFTGNVVKADERDVDYAWAMWKIWREELKEKFGVERPPPRMSKSNQTI